MSVPPPSGVRPRTAEVAAIGALFAGIFGLELIVSEPLKLWGVLYALPVVLVAQRAGRSGGLAAAGVATALMIASAQISGSDPDVVSYVLRAGTLVAVAVLAAAGGARWVGGADAPNTVLSPHSPVAGSPPDDHDIRRREALELIGVAMWELDVVTGMMRWSDEYQALYGIDPRAPLTSRAEFQQIVHPEDRDLVLRAIEKVAADGTTIEVRYRITRPDDGAERILRSHIRAREEAGGKRGLIGTAQDVTHLVRILTPRESEMLMLLADGLSGAEIAEQLVLSPATVRTHIQNAMAKLGTHTRGQAIAAALRSDEIGS